MNKLRIPLILSIVLSFFVGHVFAQEVEVLVIENGKVVIGTGANSPTALLHVHGDQEVDGKITTVELEATGGDIGVQASGSIFGIKAQSAGTAVEAFGFDIGVQANGNNFGIKAVANGVTGIGVDAVGGTGGTGLNATGGDFGVRANATSISGIGLDATGANFGIRADAGSAVGIGVKATATGSAGRGVDATGGRFGVIADGGVIDFFGAGPTTNFHPFTGAHEVIFHPSVSGNVQQGLIFSNTGDVKSRAGSISSTLPEVTLSSVANDKAVLGVFVLEYDLFEDHWYFTSQQSGDRFASLNAVGEGRIWVSNIDGDVSLGDYITTSIIPGYGKVQGDDFLHSYTVAKCSESIDWSQITTTITHNGQIYRIFCIAVTYHGG